jgi:hypothetical protein
LATILEEGNLTREQEQILLLLDKDELFDFGIMTKLGLSRNHYYDVKAVILSKIERIATERGFISSIYRR